MTTTETGDGPARLIPIADREPVLSPMRSREGEKEGERETSDSSLLVSKTYRVDFCPRELIATAHEAESEESSACSRRVSAAGSRSTPALPKEDATRNYIPRAVTSKTKGREGGSSGVSSA